MRVLHVLHNDPNDATGGAEINTLALCEAMARSGHDAHIFIPNAGHSAKPDGSEQQSSEVHIHAAGARKASRYAPPLVRFLRTFHNRVADVEFRECLRRVDPDLIHFQHTLGHSGTLIESAADAQLPIVLTVHDYWPVCQRISLFQPSGEVCTGPGNGARCAACWAGLHPGIRSRLASHLAVPFFLHRTSFHRKLIQLAHRIILPSSFLLPFWAQYVPPSRLRVVPYGVPRVMAERTTHGQGIRFGYIGTIRPHKGIHVLVEAFSKAKVGASTLAVWGDTQTDAAYSARLRELKKDSSTVFRGAFRHQDLGDILSNIDILAVPSLWAETGPLVVLEALSAGVPVIGSDIGGIRERISRHGNGALFPPGDVDALSRLLSRAVANSVTWISAQECIPHLSDNLGGVMDAYRDSVLLASTRPALRRWASADIPPPTPPDGDGAENVTVAIPCKNGSAHITRCVQSIREQTRSPLELIFVDDASTDDSAVLAKQLGINVLQFERWRGLAAGRNRAMECAKADIVVYVDVDTQLMPDMIEHMLPWFDDPNVVGVVGQGIEARIGGVANQWRRSFWRQAQGIDVVAPTALLSGICCALRTERLRSLGGFRSEYRTHGEDVDMGLRLEASGGMLVYEPRAVVLHHRRDTLASLCRLTARHTFWQVHARKASSQSSASVVWHAARWIPVCFASSIRRHRSFLLAATSLAAGGCSLLGGIAALLSAPSGEDLQPKA